MIQNEFKDAVFEFVKFASDVDWVESIILFGSVAKGDAVATSDIDFLVIVSNMKVEKKVLEIANEIGDKFNKRFQVIVKTKKLSDLDSSMLEIISREGILFYGMPINLKQKDLELEPYTVAIYSLAELPQSEKMKFKRSFFGSKSVFKKDKKIYKTVQEGILKLYNGARLGRGTIIFSPRHKEIINQLKYFKVKFKTFNIYANKQILDWINSFVR